MNIHIVGSNGYVAKRLISRIEKNTSNGEDSLIKYSSTASHGMIKLDLFEKDSIDATVFKVDDYVVMLAAISSPDFCERQYDYASAVNVAGTSRLIEKALSAGANVLFFSSDTVLGPTNNIADENATPNPSGRYAEMKYQIEEKFRGDNRFKVFRLSYVFSDTDKFTSYLLKCDSSHKCAEVFAALYRNVIYIDDVIDAVLALKDRFVKFHNQIFNLSGISLLSRSNMAEIIRSIALPTLIIEIVSPPIGFLDIRPNIIHSTSLYLKTLLGREPTSFREAVKLEFRKE